MFIVAFEGPLAVTVSNNQHYDHQQGDCLEHPLNRTTPIISYVNASVEAALSVAYKLALERTVRHGARDQIFQALSLFFYMGRIEPGYEANGYQYQGCVTCC